MLKWKRIHICTYVGKQLGPKAKRVLGGLVLLAASKWWRPHRSRNDESEIVSEQPLILQQKQQHACLLQHTNNSACAGSKQ